MLWEFNHVACGFGRVRDGTPLSECRDSVFVIGFICCALVAFGRVLWCGTAQFPRHDSHAACFRDGSAIPNLGRIKHGRSRHLNQRHEDWIGRFIGLFV